MSSVHKCDRCGGIYDTEDFFAYVASDREVKRMRIVRFFTALRNGLGFAIEPTKKCYDLCPQCQRKLLRFMDGEDDLEDS